MLFGFNVKDEEQLAAATRTLQEAAAAGGQPPLLIAVDQEGGGIRRLPWAQPVASATRMGRMEPDEVRSIGAATGQALAAVGANVDLAPVADAPDDNQSFMRDARRTFSDDPEVVSRMVTAFSEGLASQDVLATAKHFPGIGRVARNTDRFVESVREPADELDRDLAPFKAAIEAGVSDHHAVQRDVPGVRPGQRRGVVAGDRDRPPARPAWVHRRLDHRLPQRDGEVARRHAGVARPGSGRRRDRHHHGHGDRGVDRGRVRRARGIPGTGRINSAALLGRRTSGSSTSRRRSAGSRC